VIEIYAIETYKLTKIYKNNIIAVDNVNLKVPKGVILGLLVIMEPVKQP